MDILIHINDVKPYVGQTGFLAYGQLRDITSRLITHMENHGWNVCEVFTNDGLKLARENYEADEMVLAFDVTELGFRFEDGRQHRVRITPSQVADITLSWTTTEHLDAERVLSTFDPHAPRRSVKVLYGQTPFDLAMHMQNFAFRVIRLCAEGVDHEVQDEQAFIDKVLGLSVDQVTFQGPNGLGCCAELRIENYNRIVVEWVFEPDGAGLIAQATGAFVPQQVWLPIDYDTLPDKLDN